MKEYTDEDRIYWNDIREVIADCNRKCKTKQIVFVNFKTREIDLVVRLTKDGEVYSADQYKLAG